MSLTYMKTYAFLCLSLGVIALCLVVPVDTVYAKDPPSYARFSEDIFQDIGIHYCEDRLLVKISTATQACVSIESGERLVERGWGKYYEQPNIILHGTNQTFMSPNPELIDDWVVDNGQVINIVYQCTGEPNVVYHSCVLTFRNGTSTMYQSFMVTHPERYMEYHTVIQREKCIKDYIMSDQTMSLHEFAEDAQGCQIIMSLDSEHWPFDFGPKIKNDTDIIK